MTLEVQEHIAGVRLRKLLHPPAPRRVVTCLDHAERRRYAVSGEPRLDLQHRLPHQAIKPTWIDAIDGARFPSEVSQCREAHSLKELAIGAAQAGEVDQRVGRTPLLGADRRELAESAMPAGLRRCEFPFVFGSQHRCKLSADAAPVGSKRPHIERLETPRPQPQVHTTWTSSRHLLDGVGVEAQLQDVPRLGVNPSKLRIHGLIGGRAVRELDSDKEVRDAANTLMDQRHLVDHVVALIQRVADPAHPRCEGLASFTVGDAQDGQANCEVGVQAFRLVLKALVRQKPSERPEGAFGSGNRAVLDLMPQREVMGAVKPSGDLRWREQTLRHPRRSLDHRPPRRRYRLDP